MPSIDDRHDVDLSPRRYEALVTLLSRPDLPCLPTRARTWRFGGDPARRDALKRDLARAYLAYRTCTYADADEQIVSVRRSTARHRRTAS